MLDAILKNKVKSTEDILTSCVFNTLETIPWDVGLIPWFQKAKNLALESLEVPESEEISIHYWPNEKLDTGRCQPDLIIELAGNRIIVEVKWNAPLSDYEVETDEGQGSNQLTQQRAIFGADEKLKIQLLITPDSVMPRKVMEDAITTANPGLKDDLYWVSFRTLLPVTHPDNKILDKLTEYFDHIGFLSFTGFYIPKHKCAPDWTFTS